MSDEAPVLVGNTGTADCDPFKTSLAYILRALVFARLKATSVNVMNSFTLFPYSIPLQAGKRLAKYG